MDECLVLERLRRLEVLGCLVRTFLVRRPCLVVVPFLEGHPCSRILVGGHMVLLKVMLVEVHF